MLIIKKTISPERLTSLLNDLQYAKVEIRPSELQNKSNIVIRCYYPVTEPVIRELKGSLVVAIANRTILNDDKKILRKIHINFTNQMWVPLHDFQQLLEIDERYDLKLAIPVLYKNLSKEVWYLDEIEEYFIEDESTKQNII